METLIVLILYLYNYNVDDDNDGNSNDDDDDDDDDADDVRVATPVVTDAISVKRLRHGGAVELKWRPSASDGTGLILYVVEGSSISRDTNPTDWTLLTRVPTVL